MNDYLSEAISGVLTVKIIISSFAFIDLICRLDFRSRIFFILPHMISPPSFKYVLMSETNSIQITLVFIHSSRLKLFEIHFQLKLFVVVCDIGWVGSVFEVGGPTKRFFGSGHDTVTRPSDGPDEPGWPYDF